MSLFLKEIPTSANESSPTKFADLRFSNGRYHSSETLHVF